MSLKLQYRNLETKCYSQLRALIEKSKKLCAYTGRSCLEVEEETDGGYISIILVQDRLTFVDSCGLHFNVYEYDSLETLINIIDNN